MQELRKECKECGTWKCKGCIVALGVFQLHEIKGRILNPKKAEQPVLEVKKSEQLTLDI